MEQYNEKLEKFNRFCYGKKIAIIGLGVSNIPLLEYFFELNCRISVFDNRNISDLPVDLQQQIRKYHVVYFGGENNLENLKDYDIIFRSPSLMPYKYELEQEAKKGAIITTEIEQVIRLAPCKIIGVTGTEGKTTTSSIIYEIIKNAGYNCYLGGNIGNPIFTKIKDMKKDDIIILELSSFQLTRNESQS